MVSLSLFRAPRVLLHGDGVNDNLFAPGSNVRTNRLSRKPMVFGRVSIAMLPSELINFRPCPFQAISIDQRKAFLAQKQDGQSLGRRFRSWVAST